jgi:hypothetical protein
MPIVCLLLWASTKSQLSSDILLVEMLDPLTALSLAASIVQVVDFSSRLFRDSVQIYEDGSTSEHEDIKSITTDLNALAGRIQDDLEPTAGSNGPFDNQ